MGDNKNLLDDLAKLGDIMKESSDQYDKECDAYWNNLSYEDKLKAFYSVCKRINKGDVIERGSYRYVLYDVFGFGMDSYSIGMDCGYMVLHNLIQEGLEKTNDDSKIV